MMNRSVMKRQMFNRGGGVQGLAMGGPPMGAPAGPPMAPPMMPPEAPPMGPEQALAGAEAQGQEMGMMAMDGVMQNIDGAQDYQSLIDGIRGNQQPLEARYAELGSIVGEQDAMQTPESVLALTQPAIMMTEEGAVNSGIGELMQGHSRRYFDGRSDGGGRRWFNDGPSAGARDERSNDGGGQHSPCKF